MTQIITIEDIKKFVDLQTALFNLFIKKYPATKVGVVLTVPERDGIISLDGDEWSFHKHGAGVRFTRFKDGVIVDNDRKFDRPEFFSEGRLMLYLESINNREYEFQEIEDCLLQFKNNGLLYKATDYFYRLC